MRQRDIKRYQVIQRGHKEIHNDTKEHLEIPNDTKKHLEIPNDTKEHLEIPNDTKGYYEVPNKTKETPEEDHESTREGLEVVVASDLRIFVVHRYLAYQLVLLFGRCLVVV